MLLVLYLSAKFSPLARAPVPAIVTLEPSLFVLGCVYLHQIQDLCRSMRQLYF